MKHNSYDSHEFIVKTNKDVDEWMDGFFVDGRKSSFRLMCQWAWQEQERRHQVIRDELLQALVRARDDLNNAAFLVRKELGEHSWLYGIEKGKKIADEAIKLAEGDKS